MAAHTGKGITGNTLSVTSTATAIVSPSSSHRSVVVQNIDTVDPVYLGGGTGLTTSNGFRIAAGESLAVDIPPLAELYVIGSSEEIRFLVFDGTR